MVKYKYFNPNPLGNKKANDCVVRALCKATNESWDNVFSALCKIAFELKMMPNSNEVWEKFLIEHGFCYSGIKVEKGERRLRVKDFSREDGIYILSIANHLVCVKNGYYHDTWECGNKCVYSFWEKL